MLESLTVAIAPAEMAFSVYEENRPTSNGKARHRYQTITVIRNDKPVVFTHDLGDAGVYNRGPIRITTGLYLLWNGERVLPWDKIPFEAVKKFEAYYTVEQALDIADWKRAEAEHEVENLLPDPIDIPARYIERLEEVIKWQSYRSTYGYGGFIQRNAI